jgi:hypothetical protein
MDRWIGDMIREYHVLVHNVIYICIIIAVFTCIAGAIRFGIAVYRRHKGVYPPATSQGEHH